MSFKKIVFPNGLRLITVPQPQSLATTAIILVEAGSKYETKNINGISHFLEHMCFKGTERRPSALRIAEELDRLGAKYNASTGHEYTTYYAKFANRYFEQAFDIIADLYLNPVFDPKEIEKEKGVIIEEINMYEDMPARRVHELFMSLLYGDQPAGWDIAGRKEVIQRIKRDDFLSYRAKHYLPQATTVVVAGGAADLREVKNAVSRNFGSLKNAKKHPKLKVREYQKIPKSAVRYKESDQTHLVLGFRAFPVTHRHRFTLEVLANILGGGMSSRLFQSIREEMGAAYYVNASADFYSDHGYIAAAAGIRHTEIDRVIAEILRQFARLKKEPVGKPELQKVKDSMVGQLFLSLETSEELGYFYGGQEVMRLPLETPQDVARRVRAVTAEDIRTVARALFRNQSLNLAVIGPFKRKNFRNVLKL